ncbi:hypothetical protein HDV00_004060 [Rhizophlyctis rosea]|nr:hypothetical protein HDV00_004060 [Rhizophlyctis rosea]
MPPPLMRRSFSSHAGNLWSIIQNDENSSLAAALVLSKMYPHIKSTSPTTPTFDSDVGAIGSALRTLSKRILHYYSDGQEKSLVSRKKIIVCTKTMVAVLSCSERKGENIRYISHCFNHPTVGRLVMRVLCDADPEVANLCWGSFYDSAIVNPPLDGEEMKSLIHCLDRAGGFLDDDTMLGVDRLIRATLPQTIAWDDGYWYAYEMARMCSSAGLFTLAKETYFELLPRVRTRLIVRRIS